ncbi:MAG TPA: choice-of-anchor D domain-containing protein, partial [Kofleriaceae bacterium]|nr:choice-of-anchor D domain-containing protein [Kofleriaceae bacterium]
MGSASFMLPTYWLGSVVVMAVVASGGVASAAPTITTSPQDFGSVRVANATVTTATRTFSIKNDGDADLVISSYAIGGGNAGDFAITAAPATPTTVAPNAAVGITVKFDPSAPGARVASLDIASNDPVTPTASVALTGTGTNALISVPDLDVGIVTNGTTGAGTITVANIGAMPQGPLRVTSAAITGGSWFTFGANGASACGGQTTCTFAGGGFDVPPATDVSVRCSPPANASGPQTATVTFTSDTDLGGDSTATLTCTAGRADLTFTPSLAFGDVFINPSPAPSMTVTVGNTGNQSLVFTATRSGTAGLTALYTLGGCFSNCTVMPGTMQQFTVTFNPTAPTSPNADISIKLASNDPDDATVTIPVTGRGTAPDISAPMTLSLGGVEVGKTSTAQTLTVTNNGTATLTITNASFTSGGADYVAMTGTTGAQMTMVPPGGSTTWDIVCTPTAQGSRPGTFRIASNAFMKATVDVGLTCTGQQGALVVSVAPSGTTIDFGSLAEGNVATRNFTLRNTGNLPVTNIAAVVNPANKGYSIDPSTPVPTMLAAGASVTLKARFAPAAPTDGGPATITFTGDWGSTPSQTSAVLTLAGVALSTGFALNPAAIDFGNLRFDTTPTSTFCIQNTGQTAITIQTITIAPGTGTMSGEFAVTNIKRQTTCGTGGSNVTLPQSLATTADFFQVTVTADPANRTGMMAATLTVTSDLAVNPTRTLSLAGNSTSGAFTIAPASMIDFGPVDVQGTAVSQMFTITNTGDGPLDLGSFARNADPEFTITLPPGTKTLQPTQTLTIPITYKPVVASPASAPETVTITHSIAGVINGPVGGTLVVKGRGIDRNLSLLAPPAFPDTFRNPGDQAPVRGAKVQNTGEAPLKVSAVMITGATDVWQLVDPAPVDIAPGATHDFLVRFAPKRAGRAPDATLRL